MQPVRQAIIMAAGRGTRLRPITDTTAKPMIHLSGRPILEYTLKVLPETIDEVLIIVGYQKEQITNHFGNAWNGKTIRYIEQTTLNGTAGAIMLAKPWMHNRALVLNGDDLYTKDDLTRLVQYERAILGKRSDTQGRFGALSINEHGMLSGIQEAGHGAIINTGAYCIDQHIFSARPVAISETEYGLPQTIAEQAVMYPVQIVLASAWMPIGYPKDIPIAETWLNTHTPFTELS